MSSRCSKFNNASARLINPVTIATTGVNNPNSKSVAPVRIVILINQPETPIACTARIVATNARSSSKPNPGQPVGKAGNSFCRIALLYRRSSDRCFKLYPF